VEVSTANPYEFRATKDVNLVANFYALDFDTYAPMLWGNTFMLKLRKLAEDGYEVIGCKWFKNGVEEKNTRTVSEYSYSAGPKATDLLEQEPTYYMFQLITKNYGTLSSSIKYIISYDFSPAATPNSASVPVIESRSDLKVYPNPLPSGGLLTIESVAKDSPIAVYNQAGVCVYSVIATDSVVTFILPIPAGVYFLRIGDKVIRIVVGK
jgi:hypothetical protein